jgi:hypothetical protein
LTIVEEYALVKSAKQVAENRGIGEAKVLLILHRNGIKPTRYKAPKIDNPELKAKVLAMRAEGHSYRTIEAVLPVSKSWAITVCRGAK